MHHFYKMADIRGHVHLDELKVDLWKYLHIDKFLNVKHFMAENKGNYFLRCVLIFVFSSFDREKKKKWTSQRK